MVGALDTRGLDAAASLLAAAGIVPVRLTSLEVAEGYRLAGAANAAVRDTAANKPRLLCHHAGADPWEGLAATGLADAGHFGCDRAPRV